MKPFSVQLPAYEGPLDLLLTLVRTHQLALDDLPLAPLAAQYLAYIQQAEALDVNLSIEWIDMAARLIQWKSASLLPSDPTLADPAASLAQELTRELKTLSEAQMQEAAVFLAGRGSESERLWSQANGASLGSPLPGDDGATLWTMRSKAQSLRDLFRHRRQFQVADYELDLSAASVEEMKAFALQELETIPPGVWFSSAAWFRSVATLERRICLFLAILDLAVSGVVRVDDDTAPGSVRLFRAT